MSRLQSRRLDPPLYRSRRIPYGSFRSVRHQAPSTRPATCPYLGPCKRSRLLAIVGSASPHRVPPEVEAVMLLSHCRGSLVVYLRRLLVRFLSPSYSE